MTDSHLTDDEVEALIAKAIKAETERCAKLVELRGDIARRSAEAERKRGTYITLFGHTKTNPYFDRRARIHDEVGRAFDIVALCIRAGKTYPPEAGS